MARFSRFFKGALCSLLILGSNAVVAKDVIKVGQEAMDFSLKDQNGKEVNLKDFRGKKVLLSFHPLAWTAG